MRIAVIGLGAVGGYLAARLAGAGHEVSGLARGAVLRAVQANGLQLEEAGVVTRHAIQVADQATALGPHDVVIVAVKAPALASAIAAVPVLRRADAPVLTAMNGVPWWFLQTEVALPTGVNPRLHSVDPDGSIAAGLPLRDIVAGVVHLTCSTPAPGCVRHGFGNRLILGEPTGGSSERVRQLCAVLAGAGLQAEAEADIRQAIWFKLWGNMTTNPVSALTGATADKIFDDPLVRRFCLAAMAEAAEIGRHIGCPIAQSGEERMAVGRLLGAFKTSMLQDAEAGRPIELDALLGSVHEIGGKLGIQTPLVDALLGLTRLMATTRGLLPSAASA